MKKHVTLKQMKDSKQKMQILSENESMLTNGGLNITTIRPLYGIIYYPCYGIVPVEDIIKTIFAK
jgi:hypothetical protein